MSNDLEYYPAVAKFLHWAIAVMIIFNLLSGLCLAYFFKLSKQIDLVGIHKQIGVMILVLVALRIIWRLTHKYPGSLSLVTYEKVMAHLGHFMLYVFMLLIPLSGLFFSQSVGKEVHLLWFKLPQFISKLERAQSLQILSIHKYLSITIAVLIGIHLIAVLKHHFIDKHPILARMLPKSK